MDSKLQQVRVPALSQSVPPPFKETTPAGSGEVAASPIRSFLRGRGSSAMSDGAFKWAMLLSALSLFGIVALIVTELVLRSQLTLHKFGLGFFFHSGWDPVAGNYGALPFIYGTLVSSAVDHVK